MEAIHQQWHDKLLKMMMMMMMMMKMMKMMMMMMVMMICLIGNDIDKKYKISKQNF